MKLAKLLSKYPDKEIGRIFVEAVIRKVDGNLRPGVRYHLRTNDGDIYDFQPTDNFVERYFREAGNGLERARRIIEKLKSVYDGKVQGYE